MNQKQNPTWIQWLGMEHRIENESLSRILRCLQGHLTVIVNRKGIESVIVTQSNGIPIAAISECHPILKLEQICAAATEMFNNAYHLHQDTLKYLQAKGGDSIVQVIPLGIIPHTDVQFLLTVTIRGYHDGSVWFEIHHLYQTLSRLHRSLGQLLSPPGSIRAETKTPSQLPLRSRLVIHPLIREVLMDFSREMMDLQSACLNLKGKHLAYTYPDDSECEDEGIYSQKIYDLALNVYNLLGEKLRHIKCQTIALIHYIYPVHGGVFSVIASKDMRRPIYKRGYHIIPNYIKIFNQQLQGKK